MHRTLLITALLSATPLLAQDGVLTFSEQAAAAGIQFTHQNANSFTQANYTAGGAVGDWDRDGRSDLFVISGGKPDNVLAPDKLFMNDGDGSFTDEAVAWGLGEIHNGKGASAGDYNDDGWLDLYVTSAGPVNNTGKGHHRLYRNNGNRSFTNVATAAGVNALPANGEEGFCSTFGDYDLDGDLDLFVAGHSNGGSNNGASSLFRNDGDGSFTDVTAAIGFWSGTPMNVAGFSPRFCDMNGDHYPEMLLVGDFGTSRFFVNDGDGTFTDATNAWNAGQDENGMGGTLADFNRDGRADWYVTSILGLVSSWTGNKLYLNTAANVFNEISQSAGVWDGGYGWGTVAVDFDHDGWVDIAETNGDNGTHIFVGEQSYLWMNNGDNTYDETAIAMGFAHFDAGRGMVNLDYDDDGDQDMAIFANFAPLTLWENQLTGDEIHWLRVFLDTTVNDELAADGFGAVVRVTTGAETQSGFLTGGNNFMSTSELSVHFGLGAHTLIDELRVEWSNGDETVLTNVAVDQTLTVTPPEDDQWTRTGLGRGGNNGVPQIRGSGPLTAGSVATVTLTSGRPASSAFFVFSPSLLEAPFKGGTLVPFPDFLIDFPTNLAGVSAPATVWPAGIPSGAPVYFQVWQQDASGLNGWISSNGLIATSP